MNVSRRLSARPLSAALPLALLLASAGCGNDVRPSLDFSEPPDLAGGGDGGVRDLAPAPDGGGGGDGGAMGPKITECPGANLPPLASGVCEVTAGGDDKLITGTVLTPGEVLRGGQVLVDAKGLITCVACDCTGMAPANPTKITCPKGVISPGLINTHDHINYTQSPPDKDTGERYEQRHDWRTGARGHTRDNSGNTASTDQIQWGELRFVMAGATSSVSSSAAAGFLRNLDDNLQEGLGKKAVHFQTFPLGDSDGTQLSMGCGYKFTDTAASIMNDSAYFPHVAEGIDSVARNEFLCSSSSMNGAQDLTQPQSAFIHSAGLTAPDYALMATESVTLVWSPRSNIRLYGNTAQVTVAARLGALITLGTDWTQSGSMNMLRELRCADDLNRTYYDKYFTDEELWLMATYNGAVATATEDVIGVLKKGLYADIAIFDGSKRADHRAVIAAEPADVALVMRAGKVLYGEDKVVAAIPKTGMCEAFDVCGAMRSVCAQGDIGKTFAALKATNASSYGLFFCGTPDSEPSCVPQRSKSVMGSTIYDGSVKAGDADGDGIPDGMDNCPKVFNPIRPVDESKQADFDADSVGDACDPCPLQPNTTMCMGINPNDRDGDGIPDVMDNCPGKANADQKDGDMDLKGDACDPCPMDANPGNAACPGSIYDIKSGKTAPGSQVSLKNVLVTATWASGFFLQVKAGDPGYVGAEFSGIYVFAPMHTVKAGDRVSLPVATVNDFNGQLQLAQATVMVESSMGEAPPPPVTESAPGKALVAADIATGGPKAAALEAVIVKLLNVKVTDIAPAPGMGDAAPTNEFVVDGSLRVNDLLYLAAPFPTLGIGYNELAGIVEMRNGNMKVEPRGMGDLVLGPPRLLSLSPSPAFARVGVMGAPTIPTPMLVTLSHAPAMDTMINISSSDPAALTVQSPVKVPGGMSTAPVLVTGVKASAGVTLTATLGMDTAMGVVQVLDGSEVPKLVSLTPAMSAIAPGAMLTMTVTLDVPAGKGGVVVTLAAQSGKVPMNVTVAEDKLSATFTYQPGVLAMDTVTATLGNVSKMATVSVVSHLVINEVDYDQVAADTAEFVEIFNPAQVPVDASRFALVLINGSNNMEYLRVPLVGMIPPGGYLVVGAKTVAVPMGVLKVEFPNPQDNVQNGAPDGMALIDVMDKKVVDALSYEGAMTMTSIMGFAGTVDLVEKKATAESDSNAAVGSLCRLPNGKDSDDASVDWKFSAMLTPGAPNM